MTRTLRLPAICTRCSEKSSKKFCASTDRFAGHQGSRTAYATLRLVCSSFFQVFHSLLQEHAQDGANGALAPIDWQGCTKRLYSKPVTRRDGWDD